MLEISNLVKRYGKNEPVLKDLNLTVDGSSVVSIVGASASAIMPTSELMNSRVVSASAWLLCGH